MGAKALQGRERERGDHEGREMGGGRHCRAERGRGEIMKAGIWGLGREGERERGRDSL